MSASTSEQYLVMGFRAGQCVRLERSGALAAQRAVRRMRQLGWAVSVLAALEDPTLPAPARPPS